MRLRTSILAVACVALLGPAAGAPVALLADAPRTNEVPAAPLACWSETWHGPRPVRLHLLSLDLTAPAYEVCVILGDDPDGAGPAEATLQPPQLLAQRHGLIAAVNANAFWHLPGSPADVRKKGWAAGDPVHVFGLVVTGGVRRSDSDARRMPLWLDGSGRAHVGFPVTDDRPQQAVADWDGALLRGGRIVAPAGVALHPRTLAGIDAAGRRLLLVVADGRRKGYSEGLALSEAAALMLAHGCTDAINLDGGGSSIMLAATNATLSVINRPSGGFARPIPVMLGVRLRKPGTVSP